MCRTYGYLIDTNMFFHACNIRNSFTYIFNLKHKIFFFLGKRNRPIPLSQEEKDLMLQVEDISETVSYVAGMKKHVCINQITISPTHNRLYI